MTLNENVNMINVIYILNSAIAYLPTDLVSQPRRRHPTVQF